MPGRRAAARRRRIGWSRRIGLLGGLLLAAAGVVLAGQALRDGPPSAATASPAAGPIGNPTPTTPGTTPYLPPAPMIELPALVTASATITVTARLRDSLAAGGGPYWLRVYVNDRLRREVRISRHEMEFRVAGVPLARGSNTITATVAGSFGETLPSVPAMVELDDEPPPIVDLEPADGTIVYGETIAIRGATRPGATVTVTNAATGSRASVEGDAGGRFSVLLALAPGANQIVVGSRDAAGNSARRRVTIELRESGAEAIIELSRDSFEVARLPATMTIVARLTGHDGRPLDGVEVAFSISAPGQMTATYSTVSRDGLALWSGFLLPREGAQAGRGLVTVLVTLSDGEALRNSASFTFR